MREKLSSAFLTIILFASALFGTSTVSGRYALILSDPPVAERFTSKDSQRSAEAGSYKRQIEQKQQVLRKELESRKFTVTGSVQILMNAVFVAAPSEKVPELRALPGVNAVVPLRRYHRKLNKATPLVDSPAAWAKLGGTQNAGAGVKIAIIDTGIDQTHPAFQDPSLAPPAGFTPSADSAFPSDPAFTNNKVIVARSYVPMLAAPSSPANPAADSRPDDYSARDRVGHGSAVASCAAAAPNSSPIITFNGVAPKAYLGSYKIFGSPQVNDSTSDDVIIRALEDALADGMDIASLSLGEPAFTGPSIPAPLAAAWVLSPAILAPTPSRMQSGTG
jgi:minor extracellular serine protease Vpr